MRLYQPNDKFEVATSISLRVASSLAQLVIWDGRIRLGPLLSLLRKTPWTSSLLRAAPYVLSKK